MNIILYIALSTLTFSLKNLAQPTETENKTLGTPDEPDESTTMGTAIFPDKGSLSQCFLEREKTFLSGLARRVFSEPGVDRCLTRCLESQLMDNFTCLSALYYASVTLENCILNGENRYTRPKLIASEPDVVYYENRCSASSITDDMERSAAANISKVGTSTESLIGYVNVIHNRDSKESTVSAFIYNEMPGGVYALYLGNFPCVNKETGMPEMDFSRLTQMMDIQTNEKGILISNPVPSQLALDGPQSVIGQTVFLAEKLTNQTLGCGKIVQMYPTGFAYPISLSKILHLFIICSGLIYYLLH